MVPEETMTRLREDLVAFRELYESLRDCLVENREDSAHARRAAAELRARSRALRRGPREGA
jgi:hypothetical protein